MMKCLRTAVFLAATTAMAPVANAATVSFSAIPDMVIANPTADIVTGTVTEGMTNSLPTSRSPWQENGDDVGVKYTASDSYYTSVSKNSSALYNLGDSIAASVVWGSPDLYNTVEFLHGGNVVDSYVLTRLTDIYPAVMRADGALARFTNIAGGVFDSIRMSSAGYSFEYANLSTTRTLASTPAPVPLPAGGVLLISAIGGFAALRRRRRAA